jgi:hypothetical protein
VAAFWIWLSDLIYSGFLLEIFCCPLSYIHLYCFVFGANSNLLHWRHLFFRALNMLVSKLHFLEILKVLFLWSTIHCALWDFKPLSRSICIASPPAGFWGPRSTGKFSGRFSEWWIHCWALSYTHFVIILQLLVLIITNTTSCHLRLCHSHMNFFSFSCFHVVSLNLLVQNLGPPSYIGPPNTEIILNMERV